MPPYPTCNLQIHKIQWIQRCTNNLVNCIDHSPRTVQIWRLEQKRRRQQGMSPKGENTKAGIHAVPSSLHSLIEAVIVVYASTSARHGSCLNTFAQLEIYESVLRGAKKSMRPLGKHLLRWDTIVLDTYQRKSPKYCTHHCEYSRYRPVGIIAYERIWVNITTTIGIKNSRLLGLGVS